MGMRKLFFGLESGDQATLDHMKKGIRLEHVRPVLAHCRDAGILFHIFSIIGFPEETEASARNTLRFFESNADIIDHPGNSFDIHPFGLELRTEYFANASRLGLNIPTEALDKEFVIGLKGGWSNTLGLSEHDVVRLVSEYNEILRRIYCRFHNSDLHLWPGFEEFSVLYGDHYAAREFPFRTALPDDGDLSRFMITWCPDALVEYGTGTVRISSRSKLVTVSERAYRMLASEQPRTLQEFLSDCMAHNLVGAEEGAQLRIRRVINELLRGRVLQLTLIGVAEDGRANGYLRQGPHAAGAVH
jgi:hypothetical protein